MSEDTSKVVIATGSQKKTSNKEEKAAVSCDILEKIRKGIPILKDGEKKQLRNRTEEDFSNLSMWLSEFFIYQDLKSSSRQLESLSKKNIFEVLISLFDDNNREKNICTIKGESGSGKSSLLKYIFCYMQSFPDKTKFTPFYIDFSEIEEIIFKKYE